MAGQTEPEPFLLAVTLCNSSWVVQCIRGGIIYLLLPVLIIQTTAHVAVTHNPRGEGTRRFGLNISIFKELKKYECREKHKKEEAAREWNYEGRADRTARETTTHKAETAREGQLKLSCGRSKWFHYSIFVFLPINFCRNCCYSDNDDDDVGWRRRQESAAAAA